MAGASFDPAWRIKAANNYSPTIAADIIDIDILPQNEERPPQLFDEIMHAFPIHIKRVDEKFVSITNTPYSARYRSNTFTLKNGDTVIIEEHLPKLFNMHPIRLGMGEVGSRQIFMIVNKSRSSTGLYFVGLYDADGSPLYKVVMKSSQVWDIRLSDSHIDIMGWAEIRRITIK